MAVSPTSTLPASASGAATRSVDGVDGHDGQVPLGRAADDPAGELLLVGGPHRHLVGAGHHVVGGEDQARCCRR